MLMLDFYILVKIVAFCYTLMLSNISMFGISRGISESKKMKHRGLSKSMFTVKWLLTRTALCTSCYCRGRTSSVGTCFVTSVVAVGGTVTDERFVDAGDAAGLASKPACGAQLKERDQLSTTCLQAARVVNWTNRGKISICMINNMHNLTVTSYLIFHLKIE